MFGKAPNNADFTLEDFRKQFAQLAQLGGMKDVMAQMPGIGDMIPDGEDPEGAIHRIQGMMNAMTEEERRAPEIIDENRRRRIADGSGVKPGEIDEFLVQFDQVRTLMRQMAKMSMWQRLKMVTGFGKAGLFGTEAE